MSTAALEALVREQRGLIAALDADDVEGIRQYTVSVDEALVRIRSVPPRFVGAEDKQLAEEAKTLAEAARVRVNVLADMTSRRLTRMAATTGRGNAAGTYGRSGRVLR